MQDPESAHAIIASATDARRTLSDFERQLQNGIDDIDFAAFRDSRSLTAEEKARRKQLRASQTEAREASVELTFATVRRLDESGEVAHLKRRMEQINFGLRDDLEELKEIEGFAETAAKVADSIADVVAKVAERAAKVLA